MDKYSATMKKRTLRKRPFGVTVIVILQILSILSLVIEYWEGDRLFGRLMPELLRQDDVALAIALFAVLYQFVVTIGLILLQRWAWLLFMVQLGLAMAFDLWAYFNDTPYYVSMLISVVMVFYLNQRDVQQAFGSGRSAKEIT